MQKSDIDKKRGEQMWLLVLDEDTMTVLAKKEVLVGNWSKWAINLNDEKKEFTPIKPWVDKKQEVK